MNAREAATAWYRRVSGTIPAGGFATIHIDELLSLHGAAQDGRPLIAAALEAFVAIHDIVDLSHQMPSLVVSAAPTENLDLRPLSWQGLGSEEIFEPPPLYVRDRRRLLVPTVSAEYRCVVSPPELSLARASKIISHYRCYQDEEGRQRGWEFERCLYLEAFPIPSRIPPG